MLEWCGTYPLGRALMLGFKLALVGFRPSSTPRCAGVLGVPERSVCRRLAASVRRSWWAPSRSPRHSCPPFSSGSLPKLLATLVASGFPGKTRGTPLLDCPCQDTPGAPHRPVLPGWSPLFAGSPRPIPHRGAHASLTTALARGGKWSLPASPPRLRATLSGCFQLY